jgi:hypothetical protein
MLFYILEKYYLKILAYFSNIYTTHHFRNLSKGYYCCFHLTSSRKCHVIIADCKKQETQNGDVTLPLLSLLGRKVAKNAKQQALIGSKKTIKCLIRAGTVRQIHEITFQLKN